MKAIAWILLCLFSLSSLHTNAQKDKERKVRKHNLRDTASTKYDFIWDKELRKNALRFNPLSAFLLVGNIDYERRIAPWASFNINAFAGANTVYNDTDGRVYPTNFFHAGGGFDLRFYPFKKSLRGFYFGPYTAYRFFKLTSLHEESFIDGKAITSVHKGEVQMLSAGAITGYQFILGNWFALNLFAGAGYNYVHKQLFGSPQEYFATKGMGIVPYQIKAGISIGVALK